jgi:GntR family histidine utilization transcriptional repressor
LSENLSPGRAGLYDRPAGPERREARMQGTDTSADAPEPLNRRIKDFLMARILAGEWREGDRIPTERALCAQFDASRMTVNRAIRDLAEMGYLVRTRGSGTYVARVALNATMLEIRSIRQDIEARGGRHRARVLAVGEVPADADLARAFGCPEGTALARLDCLHSDGATPIQIERRHVSLDLAPGFLEQDFARVTAADYLLAHVRLTDAEHVISAIAADAETAGLLGIAPGAPCLKLTRRTRLGARLITQVDLIHPGADFQLTGHLPVPARSPGALP